MLRVTQIAALTALKSVTTFFKVATGFLRATLAILNVLVATLKAIFDQLYHRQLPQPPSRAAFLSARVLTIHDHVEYILGAPQSLLRYAGIVCLFDNLFRR